MRVSTPLRELEVAPGASTSLVLDVFNNSAVIDGVTARVIGLPDECVRSQPALLPLFPDSTGKITLTVAPPSNLPAGRHPLIVEVTSHGAHAPAAFLDIDLVVPARPKFTVSARPQLVRARRSARFVLEVGNPGNVRLQVGLEAVDSERALHHRFSSPSMTVEPGTTVPFVMTTRGPRMFSGGELDRNINVKASARRLDLPPDAVEASAEEIAPQVAGVQFRQRPLISRGLMTAFILAGIVALWAGAFLLGLAKVFTEDPLTKAAPASFFALTKVSKDGSVNVSYRSGVVAPVGALPKNGQLPPGVGSQISGTVIAKSDKQPVGRILVQAYRLRNGKPVLVASAGTQADGTYTLAGLFPLSYYVKFSATGFETIWYRTGSSLAGAAPVPTAAQDTAEVGVVTITGKPATISGTVDPGDTPNPVVVEVSARPLIGGTGNQPTARARTRPDGSYTLRNLPAPGNYELTFTATGYESSAIVDSVTGGERRLEPVVNLSAGLGSISGIVRDTAGPLGGATVTTVVNGSNVTVTTPTTGRVGFYTLDDLPTPGTYAITYSAPGHGTQTRILALGVGADSVLQNVNRKLVAGTGSVSGTVYDKDTGKGLGNVTITVGGATSTAVALPPSTRTLTGGGLGQFAVNGLVAPGSYTVTADLVGYRPATVPFALGANGRGATVKIYLTHGAGSIRGRVTGACPQDYCAGAKVTATNGQQTWTTDVSGPSSTLPKGGYLITGLQPGTYTITVTAPGLLQQSALVTVVDGKITSQPLRLGGG